MFLNLVVTILVLTIEIKLVLSYQYNVGAPVWSAKDSMYLRINLVFFTDLYMHLIYPSVESDAIAGCICNIQQTETLIIVCIIP